MPVWIDDFRYSELMNDDNVKLTPDELSYGWHFCIEWDGLLVGPGMQEYDNGCSCYTKQLDDIDMAYEQRDNSGSLFKNDKKTEERQPGWKGSALIDGQEYWLSCWVKPTKDGNGKWMSLSFELKQKPEATPAKPQSTTNPQSQSFDEDIPF